MAIAIPKWKHYLSYWYDFTIKKFESPQNGLMELCYSRGAFKLNTKEVIYSFGNNYQSFGDAFNALGIAEEKSIEKVLVLGWALGSIANLLANQSSIKKMVGVDHDKVLLDIYEHHFKDQIPFSIELFSSDVIEFVANHEQRYDLICTDIFVQDITPKGIIEPAFIKQLNNLLNPGGMVMLSKLNRSMDAIAQNKLLEDNLTGLSIEYAKVQSFGNTIYYWMQ